MDNNIFNYTYSAKEQEEIKKIRSKYQPDEEDKMIRLRRLDASVTKKASIKAITVGIVGALLMGFGMSLAMTDLGDALSLSDFTAMLIGIVTGIFGMIIIGLAYPVYTRKVKKERAKIAPEILMLTDELMQ